LKIELKFNDDSAEFKKKQLNENRNGNKKEYDVSMTMRFKFSRYIEE